jgi:hypothetical protein
MKLNIAEVDRHITFLREQADRLEKLAEERRYRWAEVDAQKMRKIADLLVEIRREHQMTGMGGKRIE